MDEVRERGRERRFGSDRLRERGERCVLVSAFPARDAEVVARARVHAADGKRALEMPARLLRLARVEADGHRASSARPRSSPAIAAQSVMHAIRGDCGSRVLQRAAQQVQQSGIAGVVRERATAPRLRGDRVAGVERERAEEPQRRKRVRRDGERALARFARGVAIAA